MGRPLRARAQIRAAARAAKGPVFVVDVGGKPARMLNLADDSGPYVPGMATIPGRADFNAPRLVVNVEVTEREEPDLLMPPEPLDTLDLPELAT